MGNKNSSEAAAQYGGIFIRFNQEILVPGESVQGTIFLNLQTPYPGVKICLDVTGSEFVRWIDKEQRSRRRSDGTTEYYYVDVERRAHRTVINREITVYDWQKGAVIPPGQYSFPFQFMMPDGLPGSFNFHRGDTVARINYSMTAFLKPENKSTPRLEFNTDVIVREMPKHPIEIKELNTERNIKTCCCLNKGIMSMRTAFEKNAYTPSEEARIVSEVDNSQCSVAVSDIRFTLNQSLHLTTGAHHRRFYFNTAKLSLGKVEPGQARTGSNRIEASMLVPADTTPTTNGSLITSNFNLSLLSKMDGCLCCDAHPSNNLPITIYSAALQKAPEPVAPANWQPQQMPVANIVIVIDPNMAQAPIQQDPNMVMSQMPQNNNQPNQMQQLNMSTYPQPQNVQQPQFNTVHPQPQGQPQPQYNPAHPQQPQVYPQPQPQYNTAYPQQPQGYPQPQPQYGAAYPQQPQVYPQPQMQQGVQQPQPNPQNINVATSNHMEPKTIQVMQSPK